MKKFYLCSILGFSLLLNLNSALAQTFDITTSGRSWTNTIGTGATQTGIIINVNSSQSFLADRVVTCTGCTINISGDASTYASMNVTGSLTLINSTVNVNNFSSINITNNGVLTVGDPSGGSTLNLTTARIIIGTSNDALDQSHLVVLDNSNININSPYSNIRIGNTSNYVQAVSTGAVTYTPTPATLLSSGSAFTINCGGTNPNACAAGTVFGPAISDATTFLAFSPLPVITVGFNASLNQDKTVSLSWTTQQEVNSNYFAVQRSADGIHWNAIGMVQAKVHSTTSTNYAFTDNAPGAGANYYRLQSFDLDGKYGFTQIRVIRAALLKTFTVYPNPARTILNVTIGGTFRGTLRLYNMSGQLILQRTVSTDKDGTTVSLPVQGLPSGHYMLHAMGVDGTKHAEKIQLMQ